MTFVTDSEFWARLLAIVAIDLMLAGDNALVIALAVRALPRHQQRWGLIWGTGGAVILRLAFVAAATVLLRVPFLQFVGGALLTWIAVKLVCQRVPAENAVRQGTSLRHAIWIIAAADAVMSLDNVLGVAGAARGDLRLVTFGIALSLPLVVWGSGILARLMNRLPWVIWLGGGVLGYVAGEMIAGDQAVLERLGSAGAALDLILPLALSMGIAALGWAVSRSSRVATLGPGRETRARLR